jgi:hypothetical protein
MYSSSTVKAFLKAGILTQEPIAETELRRDTARRDPLAVAGQRGAVGVTFDSDYENVLAVRARRDRLDAAIERWPPIASSRRWCGGSDA